MKALFAVLLTLAALAIGALFFLSDSSADGFVGDAETPGTQEESSHDLASESKEAGARGDEENAREDDAATTSVEVPNAEVVQRIRGRLVDGSGRAVADCPIELATRRQSMPAIFYQVVNGEPKSTKKKQPPIRTTSGKDGSFVFEVPEKKAGVLTLDSDEWIFPKHTSFDRSLNDIELGELACTKAATIHGTLRGAVDFDRGSINLQQTRMRNYRSEKVTPGAYTIRRLVPGPYTMTVQAAKHLAFKRKLELAPGQELHGVDLALELGQPMRGRVVDDTGAAVAGASVHVSSYEQWKIEKGSYVQSTTKSDAAGQFTIDAVDGSDLRVSVSKSNYKSSTKKYKAKDAPLLVTLRRQASIAGTLRGKDGQPIVGSTVSAKRVQQGKKRSVGEASYVSVVGDGGPHLVSYSGGAYRSKTKKDGSFVLTNLTSGDYVVVATGEHLEVESEQIHLELGSRHEGLELVAEAGVEVHVTVLGPDGAPAPGAKVEAELASEREARIATAKKKSSSPRSASLRSAVLSPFSSSMASPPVRPKIRARGETDENGVAILRGLRSESAYYFTARSEDLLTSTSDRVETGPEGPSRVTIRSEQGGFVLVRSVDAWGKVAPDTAFKVRALDEKSKTSNAISTGIDEIVFVSAGNRSGKTDARGVAKHGPLAAGKYEIVFVKQHDPSRSWISGVSTKLGDGTPFEIRAGATSEVELQAPALITIRVQVTDNGQALANESVYLMREQPGVARHGWAGTAKTDSDGVFELTGVEPGDYVVNFARGGTYDTQSRRLQIQSAPAVQRHGITLQSHELHFVVRSAEDGKALAGAEILVRDLANKKHLEGMLLWGQQQFSQFKTDGDGACELRAGRSATSLWALVGAKGYARQIVEISPSSNRVEVRLARGAGLRFVKRDQGRYHVQIRRAGSKTTCYSGFEQSIGKQRVPLGSYEYRLRRYPQPRSGQKPNAWSAWRSLEIRAGENTIDAAR